MRTGVNTALDYEVPYARLENSRFKHTLVHNFALHLHQRVQSVRKAVFALPVVYVVSPDQYGNDCHRHPGMGV